MQRSADGDDGSDGVFSRLAILPIKEVFETSLLDRSRGVAFGLAISPRISVCGMSATDPGRTCTVDHFQEALTRLNLACPYAVLADMTPDLADM